MRMPRIVLGMLEEAIVRVEGDLREFLLEMKLVRYVMCLKDLVKKCRDDG
jgi:hypothetical protein